MNQQTMENPCVTDATSPCEKCQQASEDHCFAACYKIPESDWRPEYGKIDYLKWRQFNDIIRCKRDRAVFSDDHFPGMCHRHGKALGLSDMYKNLNEMEREFVRLAINYSSCSLEGMVEFIKRHEGELDPKRLMQIVFSPMGVFGMPAAIWAFVLQLYNVKRILNLFLSKLAKGQPLKPEETMYTLAYDNFAWLLEFIIPNFPFLNEGGKAIMQGDQGRLQMQRIALYWNLFSGKLYEMFISFGQEQFYTDVGAAVDMWHVAWQRIIVREGTFRRIPESSQSFYGGLISGMLSLLHVAFLHMNPYIEEVFKGAKSGKPPRTAIPDMKTIQELLSKQACTLAQEQYRPTRFGPVTPSKLTKDTGMGVMTPQGHRVQFPTPPSYPPSRWDIHHGSDSRPMPDLHPMNLVEQEEEKKNTPPPHQPTGFPAQPTGFSASSPSFDPTYTSPMMDENPLTRKDELV